MKLYLRTLTEKPVKSSTVEALKSGKIKRTVLPMHIGIASIADEHRKAMRKARTWQIVAVLALGLWPVILGALARFYVGR